MCMSVAKKLCIPTHTFSKAAFDEGSAVLDTLRAYKTDYIVLAGFLLKVSKPLLDAYPRRIVNIHPALLPKYGGKGMYGERCTGRWWRQAKPGRE